MAQIGKGGGRGGSLIDTFKNASNFVFILSIRPPEVARNSNEAEIVFTRIVLFPPTSSSYAVNLRAINGSSSQPTSQSPDRLGRTLWLGVWPGWLVALWTPGMTGVTLISIEFESICLSSRTNRRMRSSRRRWVERVTMTLWDKQVSD